MLIEFLSLIQFRLHQFYRICIIRKQQNSMLNLDQLDPDWKQAELHGQANRAGLPTIANSDDSDIQIDKSLICKCCYEHVHKASISLWENSKQLQFLGFGFPLFYQFLKNCIILLVLAIFSYHALSIKNGIENNMGLCHQNSGSTSTSHRLLGDSPIAQKVCSTLMIEMARIEEYVTNEQQTLRILSFVFHMMALMYMRNRIIKLEAYYDERNTSLSDYSIIVKGLPKITGVQTSLRNFLKQAFKAPHQIKQITLLPQYDEIDELELIKAEIIDKLRPYYDQNEDQVDNKQMVNLQEDLKRIQKQIHKAAVNTKQMALVDELICQKIIFVLNSEEEKQNVLQQFKVISLESKKEHFGEHAAKIYMNEAPEPQQIIWKNANLSKKKRIMYSLLGWGLSFFVLASVFAIFFFVLEKKSLILEKAIQKSHDHPEDESAVQEEYESIALVYILMFLIIIFNKIVISSLFYKFTDLEKHSTTSNHQFSFELKLLLGLFFTTALMTLAVEAIRFQNYYQHPYGVIDEETVMFVMNSIVVPLFWLINPTRLFKHLKRKIKYGSRSMTQKEANSLMEDQKYDMGKRFAEVIEMMWFTYLYSTLIPVGAVITLFGLICYYWIDKYNLLRRSSISGQISGNIINVSVTLLDFTLLFRPVGSILFDSQIRDSYRVANVVMIVAAFVYILLPKKKLIDLINQEKFKMEEKTYMEAKPNFHKTYHTEHPVYRQVNFDKLAKEMKSKGFLFEITQSTPSALVKNLVLTESIKDEPAFDETSVLELRVKPIRTAP